MIAKDGTTHRRDFLHNKGVETLQRLVDYDSKGELAKRKRKSPST